MSALQIEGNHPEGHWPGLEAWINETFRPKSISELKIEFIEKLKRNKEWESLGCPNAWMVEVSDSKERRRSLLARNRYDRDQYIKDFREAKNSSTGKTIEMRPWLRERK